MSNSELHRRASEIFLQVRLLPESQRVEAVNRLARDDSQLATEVLDLLAHDDPMPGQFNDGPAPGTGTIPGEPPRRIGPYRVLSRIGKGGSGYVFLAEQDEPIRRRVAIKIVPQAAVNPELALRFEVERRALECTDHFNIARVLDAGRTDAGLPYLVMDYIEGPPITAYCEENQLGLVQRINLMLDVADAVQHVHQRGVIHRDLKPANILVNLADGRPAPRVLDFGIAKPVAGSGQLDDQPPATSGMPLGTPSYMAPEQTGLLAVDTRADVYSLAAVLYELVTGRPPIEGSGDPLEVLRSIREQVPPPASRVRARVRAGVRDELTASQMQDLDCILAKALEKSPDRRYPTVNAFAEDLRRLLRFDPIEARRPTWRYRAVRFAQRNRTLVGAAVVVALAVTLGVGGLVGGLVEAQHQRREALDQIEAQREINQFLTDDLLAASSPDDMGAEVMALDLLHRASARLEHRFHERPLIAATIHHTLGNAFAELGAYAEAEVHLNTAVQLRHVHAGVNAPVSVHSEVALASFLARLQRMEEAEHALRAAIHRARLLLGLDDPVLYTAMNDLGVVLMTNNRETEAIELLQHALAGRARLLGPQSRDVLVTTGNLAYAYDAIGQSQQALDMMIEGLRIAESLPDSPRFTILGFCNNIGATYQDMGENEAAAPYLRRAAELADESLGPDHPATMQIQANLAGLEADLGDPQRAAELLHELVLRRTELFGANTHDTLTVRYAYYNALWKAGRSYEAAQGLQTLLQDMQTSIGEDHWLTAQTHSMLGQALLSQGDTAQAMVHAQHAAKQLQELYGDEHSRTLNARQLIAAIEAQIEAKIDSRVDAEQ